MDTLNTNTERSCLHVTRVILLLSCCVFIFLVSSSTEDGGDQREDQLDQSRLPVIDVVKSLFSLPPSCDYWLFKIKSFLQQTWCFYFPSPNLDFRSGAGEDEAGSKEKVRDAVMKSLDTSKSAFEDSAKSAAELADRTVDKLKRTLSGSAKAVEEDGHNTQV